MLRAVACAHRSLPHSSSGFFVRMHSSGAAQSRVLARRVAVLTGSTVGIGFANTRRLAKDGAHVVISSRKQQNVDRAVGMLQEEGPSVAGTVCHVRKAEDRHRLVAKELGAYNVSKTALLGLTRTLALELAPKNIRSNKAVWNHLRRVTSYRGKWGLQLWWSEHRRGGYFISIDWLFSSLKSGFT